MRATCREGAMKPSQKEEMWYFPNREGHTQGHRQSQFRARRTAQGFLAVVPFSRPLDPNCTFIHTYSKSKTAELYKKKGWLCGSSLPARSTGFLSQRCSHDTSSQLILQSQKTLKFKNRKTPFLTLVNVPSY